MKLSIAVAAAALTATLFAAGAAIAAPGIANVAANVRGGPGTGYAIVGKLEKGEYVIVKSCDRSWCLIGRVGPDGYVSRSLLHNPYYGLRTYYQFAPKRPQPGRDSNR